MNGLSDEIIKKYLECSCSETEFIQINNWMKESEENACKLFRMEEAYQTGRRNFLAEKKQMETAKVRLYEQLNIEQAIRQQRLKMRNLMKYAALIALILTTGTGIGYWVYQLNIMQEMQVVNAGHAVKTIVLPDGTKVWLNAASTLTYPREFSKNERNVHLEGEAYFKVAKNRQKPFTVESESMRIRVLGTTFNFKSSKSCRVAEASLIEGEIEVKGNNNEGMIIIAPGQRAELNKSTGRLLVKQVDTRMDGVWHNGLIPFEKANIFMIAKALERFYAMKIILSPDIDTSKTYSGVLKRKDHIESVLQSLSNSVPIRYKIVDNNVFISSKK